MVTVDPLRPILSYQNNVLSNQNSLFEKLQFWKPKQNYDNSINYGLVIDCGSSGSRIFAYQWDADKVVDDITLDQVLKIPEKQTVAPSEPVIMKLEPGISSLSPSEAVDQIKRLLDFASEHIPKQAHPETILYILATAGLRMISTKTRNVMLRQIRRDISTNYQFKLQDVSVISGQEEGLYAWLSINSIMGKLCNKDNTPVGIIDMGGGSIQVAIPLNDDKYETIDRTLRSNKDLEERVKRSNYRISDADIHTVDLSCGVKHKVFIHTWLGYGANKARERYETFLLKDEKEDPCLIKDMVLNNITTSQGNFEKCREIISGHNVFDFSKEQKRSEQNLLNCLDIKKDIACYYPLDSKQQLPDIDFNKMILVGISEFFYTTRDVFFMDGKFETNKFHKEADKWCSSDNKTVFEKFSKGEYMADEYRIKSQCFKAAWMSSMLYEGLNFDIFDDKFNLQTLDTYEGKSLQWTLGALLKNGITNNMNKIKHPRQHRMVASNGKIIGLSSDAVGNNVNQPEQQEDLTKNYKNHLGADGYNPVNISLLLLYCMLGILIAAIVYICLKFLSRSNIFDYDYVRKL